MEIYKVLICAQVRGRESAASTLSSRMTFFVNCSQPLKAEA